MNTTLNFVFIIVTAATSLFASSQAIATHEAFAATVVNPPTIISVQTDTHQKQECQTVGGTSGIANLCIATSTDTVSQSGGMLKR